MSERISSTFERVAYCAVLCAIPMVGIGALIAIWGDFSIGGRIVATGFVFGLVACLIGLASVGTPSPPRDGGR